MKDFLNSQWAVINDNMLELNLCIQSLTEESACSAGDPGFIPGSRRFPGKGNCNPFQSSCLESSMGHTESDTTEQRTHTLTLTHTHKASQLWWISIRIYNHDWFSLRCAEYYLQLLSSLSFLISIGKKKWRDIVISTWKIPLRDIKSIRYIDSLFY